ncbi:hypothetical protein JOC36_000151 [Weissella uvarum]|uniref:hypothetical protein n=1 Tax=Weissella uvarum TaxID=1479233 RepID=UPI001961E2D5|nr:hypothetical protein [Weissella uvarum]MBM7616618.1 hypothetical protein [Weissella uvarum]MCM0594924.1 hypothetical protein [Weissella uvarum]
MGKYAEIFKMYYIDPTEFRINSCQKTVDDYKAGKRSNDIYTQTHSKALPLLINQRDTIRQALTYFTPEEQNIIAEMYGKTNKSINPPSTIAQQFNITEKEARALANRFTRRYKVLGDNDVTEDAMMKPITEYYEERKHEHSSN